MATAVEMPKLGNTVEECVLTSWLKHKGDTVSAGDVIAEIETDKTTFEVTAPVGGTLLESFFEEGAVVRVFTNICVVGEPGEDASTFRPQAEPDAAPEAPVEASAPAPPPAAPAVGAAYSPRARRFAEQHDFHTEHVAGSGPGGRVLESDVRAAYAATATQVSKTRQTIARRMRDSLASTAQYTLHASAEATGLLAVRARLKAAASEVNLNDLVTWCAIHALRDVPEVNAEFIEGRIQRRAEIHIGFACDTPRGLMVPVVKNAHLMPLDELARRMKEMAAQAVQGTISPDFLSGATFTVSNLGALGIESFTPILNPPQVAILGIGAIQVRPARRQGSVEFIDSIGLSLTCDHQVIDGAPGARFLQVVKEKIENVQTMV